MLDLLTTKIYCASIKYKKICKKGGFDMKKKYEKPEVALSMNGTLEGVFACGDEDSNNGCGHNHNGNCGSNDSYGWNWGFGWNWGSGWGWDWFWGKKGR